MSRFKNILTVLFMAVLTFGSVNAALVWSEEFNGPEIDKSIWTYDVGGNGFGNAELQYYTARPENARIENDNLVIEGKSESYGGREFTSARLKTHGRFAFKYGTIEIRAQVPDLADGLWPAIWMMGTNGLTWPACGEVDILEMGAAEAIATGVVNRRVVSAAHWDYQGSYASYGLSYTAPSDLNIDYHIWTMTWTPTVIDTYLDGAHIWAFDISAGAAGDLEEFHLAIERHFTYFI